MASFSRSIVSGAGVIGFTSLSLVSPAVADELCPEPFSVISVDGRDVCEWVVTEDKVLSLGEKSSTADAFIPSAIDPATVQALLVGSGGPAMKIWGYSPGAAGSIQGGTLEGFVGDLDLQVGQASEISTFLYFAQAESTSIDDDFENELFALGGYSSFYLNLLTPDLTEGELLLPVVMEFEDSGSEVELKNPYVSLEQIAAANPGLNGPEPWWDLDSNLISESGDEQTFNVELYSFVFMGGLGGITNFGLLEEVSEQVEDERILGASPKILLPGDESDQLQAWEWNDDAEKFVSINSFFSPADGSIGQLMTEPRLDDGEGLLGVNYLRPEILGFNGGDGVVISEVIGPVLNLFSNLDTCYAGGGNGILGTNSACGASTDGGILGTDIEEVFSASGTTNRITPAITNSGAGSLYYEAREADGDLSAAEISEEAGFGEDGVIILRYPLESLPSGQFSAPVPFMGPVVTDFGADGNQLPFAVVPNQKVKILGSRLADVTAVEINGEQIEIDSATDEELTFSAPANFTPGEYSVSLIFGGGSLLLQERIAFSEDNGIIPTGICSDQPKVWTKRISETQAKMYIKCPDVDVKYTATHQQDGGEYEEFFARTIADETDDAQFYNGSSRYFVRTIDLAQKSRIKIYENGELKWQVVYNEGSFSG